MSFLKKEIISEKTLLTWILSAAISTIVCLLITVFVVYLKYDCWLMYQHQLAGGTCDADINLEIVSAIPIVLGFIIGTILTIKITKSDSSNR
jgi:hypothetical protein